MGDDLREGIAGRHDVIAYGFYALWQFKRLQFLIVVEGVVAKGGYAAWDDGVLAAGNEGVRCGLNDGVAAFSRIVLTVVLVDSDADEVVAITKHIVVDARYVGWDIDGPELAFSEGVVGKLKVALLWEDNGLNACSCE